MSKGMFSNLEKTIKELSKGMTYYMKIVPDEDGYLDKECPNDMCLSKFKVQSDDWVDRIQDHDAYCPFCGFQADYEQWFTTEQIEQAKGQAVEYAGSLIGKSLKKDSRRGGFKYKGNTHFYNLPAKTLEIMQQKITCEECGFRYAVIGSAYYCPCCGKNTSTRTYLAMIEKTRASVESIDIIRNSISDRDDAERCCETLLTGALNELVVTVQRVCESVYKERVPEAKLRANIFQSLDQGSKLWEELTGQGYQDWLTDEEYTTLRTCFQRRHLFDHQAGIVDKQYIDRSGDNSYREGQRIKLNKNDLLRYISATESLCEKVLDQKNGAILKEDGE